MTLIYSWVLFRFTSATNTVFPLKCYKLSLNQLEKKWYHILHFFLIDNHHTHPCN